jgi:RNase P subunit RPR2
VSFTVSATEEIPSKSCEGCDEILTEAVNMSIHRGLRKLTLEWACRMCDQAMSVEICVGNPYDPEEAR